MSGVINSDIVVAGGGITGLYTCYKLMQLKGSNHTISLFEGTDRFIEAGDKNMAFDLLARDDVKLAYKKLLLSVLLSTTIESDFPVSSKITFKK